MISEFQQKNIGVSFGLKQIRYIYTFEFVE